MHPQQSPTGKKHNLVTIIIALTVLIAVSVMCCMGGFGAMVFSVFSAEKTYYAECEQVLSVEDCNACCKAKGHGGHAFGELINEEGKACGCL